MSGLILLGCRSHWLLEVEPFAPKFIKPLQLFFRERWRFGCCGVFSKFLKGGEIGEDGGYGGLGEAEGYGALGEGTAGIFGEETDRVGLGEGLLQPFLLAVGAMVRGVEFGRAVVVPVGQTSEAWGTREMRPTSVSSAMGKKLRAGSCSRIL